MMHALTALSFIAILIAPCVAAGRIDLEEEEAYAEQRERNLCFKPRE
ncbi:MAG TPA: hypothetical protein VF214_05725 [Edaphobacter sp.]